MISEVFSQTAYSGPDRRVHTRYPVNLEKSLSLGKNQVPIMDISWGGVLLISKTPHKAGELVEFSISGFMVTTKVLDCTTFEEGLEPETSYSIRCQFVQPTDHPDIKTLMKIVWRREFESM